MNKFFTLFNMKRFTSILLSFAMASTATITTFAIESSAQTTNKPTISEITNLQRYVAGLVVFSADEISKYDYNKDGILNITDISDWQRYIANISTAVNFPNNIKLNASEITLGKGEGFSLSVETDNNSTNYTFISDNASIATVSASGKITAINNGSTTISCVSQNGTKASCIVTVKNLSNSIEFNKHTLDLGIGEQYGLLISIQNNSAAYCKQFSSSNTSIATVDKNGKVTAKGTGTTTIKVSLSNGVSDSCLIDVKPQSNSISLNATSLNLGIGETFDLNSSIPAGYNAYFRKYYSNNSDIAKIEKSGGLVTALTSGSTSVYVEMSNGKRATCNVNVKPMAKSISLNTKDITLRPNKTYQLTSSVPSGYNAYYRKYSSNNPSVATVSENGLISSKSCGIALITVALSNGKSASCWVTVEKTIAEMENECLSIINAKRKAVGAKTVTTTTKLQQAADIRAKEAVVSLGHVRPDGRECFTVLRDLGINSIDRGEILTGYPGKAEYAVNNWLDSPPHKAIMLDNRYNQAAVGCCKNPSGGYIWVTIFIET